MLLTALVLFAVGQTFEWVDRDGVTHFTDDQASIPHGAKVRTTEGDDITVMPATPDAPHGPKRAAKPVSCGKAKQKVVALTAEVKAAERQEQLREVATRGDCGSLLAADLAACNALVRTRRNRWATTQPVATVDLTSKRAQLTEAESALRKLQVEGCTE